MISGHLWSAAALILLFIRLLMSTFLIIKQ